MSLLLLQACLTAAAPPESTAPLHLGAPSGTDAVLLPQPASTAEHTLAFDDSTSRLVTVDRAGHVRPVRSLTVPPASLHASGDVLAWTEREPDRWVLHTLVDGREIEPLTMPRERRISLSNGWLGGPCDEGWCTWSLGSDRWEPRGQPFPRAHPDEATLSVVQGTPFAVSAFGDIHVASWRNGAWVSEAPPPTECGAGDPSLAAAAPVVAWVETCGDLRDVRTRQERTAVRVARRVGDGWELLPPWSALPRATRPSVEVAGDGTLHVAALHQAGYAQAWITAARWNGDEWVDFADTAPWAAPARIRPRWERQPDDAMSLVWGVGAAWHRHDGEVVEVLTPTPNTLVLFEATDGFELDATDPVTLRWRSAHAAPNTKTGEYLWSPGMGIRPSNEESSPRVAAAAPHVSVTDGHLVVSRPGHRARRFELPVTEADRVTLLEGKPLTAVTCTPRGACTRYRLARTSRADASWRCPSLDSRTLVAGNADRVCVACVAEEPNERYGRHRTNIQVDCR